MPDRKRYEDWFLQKMIQKKLQTGLEEVQKFGQPVIVLRSYQMADESEDEGEQSISETVMNRENILKQMRVKPPEQLPK